MPRRRESESQERERLIKEIKKHHFAGYPAGAAHEDGFLKTLVHLSNENLKQILEHGEEIASKKTA